MKKTALVLMVSLLVMLTGCSNGSSGGGAGSKDFFDLINQIEVGDSLEKINEVIGSEGEVRSDNATYTWENFSAVFRVDDTSAALSVSLLYDNKDVENSKVKIKDLDALKAKVSEGIFYNDFKEYVGGVDGVLVSKNSSTNGFVWRNPNGSVVDASFRVEDNMCNSFVGSGK